MIFSLLLSRFLSLPLFLFYSFSLIRCSVFFFSFFRLCLFQILFFFSSLSLAEFHSFLSFFFTFSFPLIVTDIRSFGKFKKKKLNTRSDKVSAFRLKRFIAILTRTKLINSLCEKHIDGFY